MAVECTTMIAYRMIKKALLCTCVSNLCTKQHVKFITIDLVSFDNSFCQFLAKTSQFKIYLHFDPNVYNNVPLPLNKTL